MGFLETLNKAKAYDEKEKQNTFNSGVQKGIYAGEFNTMKALLPYVNKVKQQSFSAGHKAGVDGLASLLGKNISVPEKKDNYIPLGYTPGSRTQDDINFGRAMLFQQPVANYK